MRKRVPKRIIAATAVMVLAISLCACGKAANTGNKTSKEQTTESEPEAKPTSGAASKDTYNVVIEWLSLGNTPSEENMKKVEDAINAITVPKIGCTVTLYPVDLSNLESDTTLAISTGEKIDLVCSVGTGVGNLVSQGLIVDMDNYLEPDGADLKKCLGDALAGGYYKDKLYGVPNAYIQSEKYGYLVRTDLLKKYNIQIDPDKLYTLDELGNIFATVKAGEGDGFYCVAGITSTSNLFAEFLGTVDKLGATTASGGLLLADNWKNTTVENIYASKQYENFANTMYNWSQKGYIPSDAASNTDDGTQQIASGNYLGRIYYTTEGAASGMGAQAGYDLTEIELTPPYKTTDRYQNILWSIPVTSKDPEKAFQFLNLLYGDNDVDTMLMYGLEGETYKVVDEDGKGNRLVDFVDGVNTSNAPFYCYAGVYGDRLSWPIWKPNKITFNDDLRAFNSSVTNISPALGYCFEITDDISSSYSAVSSVISQYTPVISAGAVDPKESLTEFNRSLKDAGIDAIIAENQKQLNKWLAEQ
jgi:ABC-type sugar transport system, periplasmic component